MGGRRDACADTLGFWDVGLDELEEDAQIISEYLENKKSLQMEAFISKEEKLNVEVGVPSV